MYRTNPDFVFTVTRDFVKSCKTPVLILPDDIPAHPYKVAMEAAMLAPKADAPPAAALLARTTATRLIFIVRGTATLQPRRVGQRRRIFDNIMTR